MRRRVSGVAISLISNVANATQRKKGSLWPRKEYPAKELIIALSVSRTASAMTTYRVQPSRKGFRMRAKDTIADRWECAVSLRRRLSRDRARNDRQRSVVWRAKKPY